MPSKYWRRNITYKEILELVNFWIDNPKEVNSIPKKLSEKIDKQDIYFLKEGYSEKGGVIMPGGLNKLRDEIEAKINEYEREERNIKWQKTSSITNWCLVIITLIACITSIFYSSYSIVILKNSNAPLEPTIKPFLNQRDSNLIFFDSQLVDLYHNESWNFLPRRETIDFSVRNYGQSPTGWLRFELIDPSNQFGTSYYSTSLNPISSESFYFDIRHKDCYGGDGKEEYDNIRANGCNVSTIEKGLKKFILKVDCEECQTKDNPICYSFNICIHNSTLEEDWCKNNLKQGGSILKEVPCK